jgi:hypothetical protein
MRRISSIVLAIVALGLPLQNASLAGEQTGIPPETVTDSIHAVIESNRTFYTIHVVERLQKEGGTTAAENWRVKKNTLPLPAQFLMESSELTAISGTRIRYRLISLWPINPRNAPWSESEKLGLESLLAHPERSVTGTVKYGKETYFQAIYADHAVSQTCVECHNTHLKSPQERF